MFFVYFLPAIIWTGVILVLVLIPGSDLPNWNWADSLSLDKFIHLAVFYILIIMVLHGFKKSNTTKSLKLRYYFFSLLYGIGYGAGTELLQDLLYIERKADLIDFLANSMGCIFAIVFFQKTIDSFEKLKKRFKKNII